MIHREISGWKSAGPLMILSWLSDDSQRINSWRNLVLAYLSLSCPVEVPDMTRNEYQCCRIDLQLLYSCPLAAPSWLAAVPLLTHQLTVLCTGLIIFGFLVFCLCCYKGHCWNTTRQKWKSVEHKVYAWEDSTSIHVHTHIYIFFQGPISSSSEPILMDFHCRINLDIVHI